jgi:predicted GNAT superfamily acetyltransferase
VSEARELAPGIEKKWHGLTLRACHTVGEFRQAVALEREVWGFDDLELIPARFFVVGDQIGGHLLGAYDGPHMVAFAFGLPGVRNRRAYLHSHMLAVKEPLRNTGLGREMKLLQRELALSQGYDLIEWTFDPLEIKNAYFNLEKLGAIARQYFVNHYGITSSPLQGGLPSDRLLAEWWIRSPRVEETLRSGKHPPIASTAQIEVPAAIYEWKAQPETRALAADTQRRLRGEFQQQFSKGLCALGYGRTPAGDGRFLLAEWSGQPRGANNSLAGEPSAPDNI